MPNRRSTIPPPKAQPRGSFRQRYDELEARRTALISRLSALGEPARRHPSFSRALTLLNTTFRKVSLGRRLAVLQSANWLIDVLEQLMMLS